MVIDLNITNFFAIVGGAWVLMTIFDKLHDYFRKIFGNNGASK